MPRTPTRVQVGPADQPLTIKHIVCWASAIFTVLMVVVSLVLFFAAMKSDIAVLRQEQFLKVESDKVQFSKIAADQTKSLQKIDELSNKVDTLNEQVTELTTKEAINAAILSRLDKTQTNAAQPFTDDGR